jgi:hypothetical protein
MRLRLGTHERARPGHRAGLVAVEARVPATMDRPACREWRWRLGRSTRSQGHGVTRSRTRFRSMTRRSSDRLGEQDRSPRRRSALAPAAGSRRHGAGIFRSSGFAVCDPPEQVTVHPARTRGFAGDCSPCTRPRPEEMAMIRSRASRSPGGRRSPSRRHGWSHNNAARRREIIAPGLAGCLAVGGDLVPDRPPGAHLHVRRRGDHPSGGIPATPADDRPACCARGQHLAGSSRGMKCRSAAHLERPGPLGGRGFTSGRDGVRTRIGRRSRGPPSPERRRRSLRRRPWPITSASVDAREGGRRPPVTAGHDGHGVHSCAGAVVVLTNATRAGPAARDVTREILRETIGLDDPSARSGTRGDGEEYAGRYDNPFALQEIVPGALRASSSPAPCAPAGAGRWAPPPPGPIRLRLTRRTASLPPSRRPRIARGVGRPEAASRGPVGRGGAQAHPDRKPGQTGMTLSQ